MDRFAKSANSSQGLTVDLDMLDEQARPDAALERGMTQLVA